MALRVIRLAQLVGTKDNPGLLPVSPATIWRWVRQNKFPQPFKLSAGTTVWNSEDVEAFIAGQQFSGGCVFRNEVNTATNKDKVACIKTKPARAHVRPAPVAAGMLETQLAMLKRIRHAPQGVASFTGAGEPQLSAANAKRHLSSLVDAGYIQPHGKVLYCVTLGGLHYISEREPKVLPERVCNATERATYMGAELGYRGRVAS